MGGSNSSSPTPEGDQAPESVEKTSRRKEDQVHKEVEEESVPDVQQQQQTQQQQQQQQQQHRDQQNDNFMTETNSLHSAASSTVSIPDLADAPEVFIDTEKGKPLFTKNSPPSSVASERLTNGKVDTRIDESEQQGWQYTKENDLDQISVTNEDYL